MSTSKKGSATADDIMKVVENLGDFSVVNWNKVTRVISKCSSISELQKVLDLNKGSRSSWAAIVRVDARERKATLFVDWLLAVLSAAVSPADLYLAEINAKLAIVKYFSDRSSLDSLGALISRKSGEIFTTLADQDLRQALNGFMREIAEYPIRVDAMLEELSKLAIDPFSK